MDRVIKKLLAVKARLDGYVVGRRKDGLSCIPSETCRMLEIGCAGSVFSPQLTFAWLADIQSCEFAGVVSPRH